MRAIVYRAQKANAKEHKIIFQYDLTNFMIYDIIIVVGCLNLSDDRLFRKDGLILNEQSIEMRFGETQSGIN